MKSRKQMPLRNAGLLQSRITNSMVESILQKKGAFIYTLPSGNQLCIEKAKGDFYQFGYIKFIQVYYAEKEQYGSGIGTVFMVSNSQYFPRKFYSEATKCFMSRLKSPLPFNCQGKSFQLEEISMMKKSKINIIIKSNPDFFGDGRDGYDKNNQYYHFLTNFDYIDEEFIKKSIESFKGSVQFGICDQAFGYDEDSGGTYPLPSLKALYVKNVPEEGLGDFWQHHDQLKKDLNDVYVYPIDAKKIIN